MDQKELLKKEIEEERIKLNQLLKDGKQHAEAYQQSLVLDHLIEKYIELV